MDPYEEMKLEIAKIINNTIPSKRIFKLIMGISAEDLAGRIAKVSKHYVGKRLEEIEKRLYRLERIHNVEKRI